VHGQAGAAAPITGILRYFSRLDPAFEDGTPKRGEGPCGAHEAVRRGVRHASVKVTARRSLS
jgi:hypothetical protein